MQKCSVGSPLSSAVTNMIRAAVLCRWPLVDLILTVMRPHVARAACGTGEKETPPTLTSDRVCTSPAGCKPGIPFARQVNKYMWLCSDGAAPSKGYDRIGQVGFWMQLLARPHICLPAMKLLFVTGLRNRQLLPVSAAMR